MELTILTDGADQFQTFYSREQNVWNTLHLFRNWNSVSIEQLFGFIPFILIPHTIGVLTPGCSDDDDDDDDSYSGTGSMEGTLRELSVCGKLS